MKTPLQTATEIDEGTPMTDKLHNPPAFPANNDWHDDAGNLHIERCPGMSLRDWFAGQCILTDPVGEYTPEEFAKAAYAMADAMLVERAK